MGAVKNCVKILYYKEFAIMEKNELIKLNEEAKKQYDELCKQGLKPVSYTHLTLPTIA